MSNSTEDHSTDIVNAPTLDPSLLVFTPGQLDFLQHAIAPSEEEIRSRVEMVQNEAYAKHPYPCIYRFHHVSLMMSENDIYSRVLELGKADSEALLLDIGCCMGTDVRKAVFDGFPGSQIIACDLLPEFIMLGHKLYGDKGASSVHFITGDVFSLPRPEAVATPIPRSTTPLSDISSLSDLAGRVSFVYAGAFFHLFDEPTQHGLALRLAQLIRRGKPAILFGRHQGLENAGLIDDNLGRTRYGHSPGSWGRLWISVFKTVFGTDFVPEQVKVNAELKPTDMTGKTFLGRNVNHMLYWSVEVA